MMKEATYTYVPTRGRELKRWLAPCFQYRSGFTGRHSGSRWWKVTASSTVAPDANTTT